MLQNEPLAVAKIGVDTAEKGPWKGLKNRTIEKAPMVRDAAFRAQVEMTPESLGVPGCPAC